MTADTAPPAAPKPRNPLGIAAFVVALVAVLTPGILFLVGLVGALLEGAQSPDEFGWGLLGGLVFAFLGFGLAGPIAIVGVVLAIIALTRRGLSKVSAVIALVRGTPLAILGLLALPAAIEQF